MKKQVQATKMTTESKRVVEAYDRRGGLVERYSVFDPGHLLLMQSRERSVLKMLRARGLTQLAALKILDVGCGTGQWLHDLLRWGGSAENIVGVDLNVERLEKASTCLPGEIKLIVAEGSMLPFDDSCFDLLIMATVLSSVLDSDLREQIVFDAMRVLRPGGHLLFYDLAIDNPKNPDVVGISRRELMDLFTVADCRWLRTTLAPPLGRRIASVSSTLHHLLERLPFLRTHNLGVIRKRG
jgi:ubiquinone/menaquinone biosynthesis C-methylase UbiE